MNEKLLFQQLKKEEDAILAFCKTKRKIFLYGAGNYAYTMFKFLERHLINVLGFIVSQKVEGKFENRPIYDVHEFPFSPKEVVVLLALKSSMHEVVLEQLQKNNFVKDYIYCTNDTFHRFRTALDRIPKDKIAYFKKKFPIKKEVNDKLWKNILVICNDGIGDLILTTPFLRELRNSYKSAFITLIITKECSALFEKCPYIDQLLIYPLSKVMYIDDVVEENAKKFVAKHLNKINYDVAFLPGSYVWSTINLYIAVYSKTPIRIAHNVYGESLGDNFCNHQINELYSLSIPDDKIRHEVERRLDLLMPFGKTIKSDKIELWTDELDDQFAMQIKRAYNIIDTDILVSIVPTASVSTRAWNPKRMLSLMLRLLKKYRHMRFMIFGGDNTSEIASLFCANLPKDKIVNMVNSTSLRQAIALMRLCKLYIGMNTGLIHVAAACNIPVIEISPHSLEGDPAHDNSPLRYRAWGVPDIVIQPKHPLDECQDFCIRKSAHCINQVTVEEVEDKVGLMMKKYVK